MTDLVDSEHKAAAARFKDILSVYQHNEDMINIGAYQKGTSPEIDQAIAYYPRFMEFLRQPFDQEATLDMARQALLLVTAPLAGQSSPVNPGR
jgi:flagellar biosynthesis/type III secretory pathway ATPase